MTALQPHRRGDTFVYTFTLGSGWVGADFTGGVKWTLRTDDVESTVVDDAGAVDQATTAAGSITFSGATGTITIPASRTTSWPTGSLRWDLQGVVSGATPIVHTIDDGIMLVRPDVTRST